MQIPALKPVHVDASKLPLEELAHNPNVSRDDKIAAASKAFESILLSQILSECETPVFTSTFAGNSTTDGIYRDLFVTQLADSISKSDSLGLAKTLARTLERHKDAAGHSKDPLKLESPKSEIRSPKENRSSKTESLQNPAQHKAKPPLPLKQGEVEASAAAAHDLIFGKGGNGSSSVKPNGDSLRRLQQPHDL